jgi:DNA mismatch repair protein PMS2
VLELTAADELVALENMGVLQQNGFEVAVEEDQPAGRRLKLVAQPVSKNTEFDTQGSSHSFVPSLIASELDVR